jgi:hypothetical protein
MQTDPLEDADVTGLSDTRNRPQAWTDRHDRFVDGFGHQDVAAVLDLGTELLVLDELV